MSYDSKLNLSEKNNISRLIETIESEKNFCPYLENLGNSELVFFCSALHKGKNPDEIFDKRICLDDLEKFCMSNHDNCYFKPLNKK